MWVCVQHFLTKQHLGKMAQQQAGRLTSLLFRPALTDLLDGQAVFPLGDEHVFPAQAGVHLRHNEEIERFRQLRIAPLPIRFP